MSDPKGNEIARRLRSLFDLMNMQQQPYETSILLEAADEIEFLHSKLLQIGKTHAYQWKCYPEGSREREVILRIVDEMMFYDYDKKSPAADKPKRG